MMFGWLRRPRRDSEHEQLMRQTATAIRDLEDELGVEPAVLMPHLPLLYSVHERLIRLRTERGLAQAREWYPDGMIEVDADFRPKRPHDA